MKSGLALKSPTFLMLNSRSVSTTTGFERRFAQGDAAPGGGIELFVILNDPTRRNELRVNLLAGELFWG